LVRRPFPRTKETQNNGGLFKEGKDHKKGNMGGKGIREKREETLFITLPGRLKGARPFNYRKLRGGRKGAERGLLVPKEGREVLVS